MLSEMLSVLGGFLPSPTLSVPAPNVSVVNVTERTVGLGNRVGNEMRGSFMVAAVKGSRLDAVVRFQVWASQPDGVNAAIQNLHEQLLAAKQTLRGLGFLKLDAIETALAEFDVTLNAWHETCNYKVLYEFRFQDSDGAESLIARIPIAVNSEYSESTMVTDRMVRWDNQSAPILRLRGRTKLTRLSALAYLPAPLPSGTVTLTRTFDGAPGSPTSYPTLEAFLAAITEANPTRHGQVTFASVSAFLMAFKGAGDPIELGDWDGDGNLDLYQSRSLTFSPPVQLASASDRLEIAHPDTPLNRVAVVYLQAS
ncbi:MAG: hypothetical protein LH702_29495 [Phormidesmis sp. CAN_BIN44]|nr:hypothetical protein [Phormidesmis sp. CAN_BIN44]